MRSIVRCGRGGAIYPRVRCPWSQLQLAEQPPRNYGPTPHERTLWRALKELPVDGIHFRRQAPIGPYVVDFVCPAARLIVELGWGHHNDDATARRDRERPLWLENEGYRVVRFWNSGSNSDLTGVLERIYAGKRRYAGDPPLQGNYILD